MRATPHAFDRGAAIAIRIQCPSPECGAVCSAADAASGHAVKCPKCGRAYLARPTFDGRQGDTARTPASPNEDPFPALPAEFGRYRVLRLLGRGGMGAVYLAEDSQLGRRVALKIPFFDAKSSPQRLERFAREARSAAGLHHPNICTVFDAGEVAGRPFLTMRYVEGTPLEAEIERADGVSAARAAEVTRQVALALEFAHRAGIVHRDLKPANVMVAAGGEPVVMDFGLAKLVAEADPNEAKLTRDGGVLGTPSYMSPEQIRGDAAAIGPASDIYSLGVMLFELLTGETPYRGSVGVVMGQALAAPVRSVWELQPDADPRLEAACRRAMAKEPAARFPSMAAFAAALDSYLKAPDAPPPTPVAATVSFDQMVSAPAPARPKPKKRRPVGVAVGVALALVAVGATAAVVLRLETKDGALLVEIDDPEVEARLKGGTLTLCGPDGKVRYTLTAGERDKRLPAGPYTIRVEGADGLAIDTPEFTLKRGGKVTVKVTRAPLAAKKGAAADPNAVEFDDLGLPRTQRLAAAANSKAPASGVADGKWVTLFNGKDLAGWVPHPRWPGKWVVQGGVLTGRPDGGPLGFPHQSYLRTARNDYADFHLRVEARVQRGSKGGVLVRVGDGGEIYPSATDRWIKGYDIDIEARGAEPNWTGGIMCGNYILSPPTPPTAKPGEWFVMELVVSGWDIAVKIDGRVVNTYTDKSKRSAAGFLSLQAFGASSAIEFRKVEVQEPPAPGAAAPAPAATPDRKAAEYTLSVGGTVWVNGTRQVKAAADLPEGGFDVTGVLLRDCTVTDAGLAACAGVTKVKHLDLVNTAVTERGLSYFKDCPEIYVLDLNNTATTDAGLAHFHGCQGVGFVWLGGTKVTNQGLAGFAGCRGVIRLDLRDTGAGDAGLANFKESAALEFLNLDGSKVTDAALATLKGFPKLASLHASRTPMTAKGVAALRAALPKCEVAVEDPAP